MKAAKKTMLMDGAKVAYTHGQYGKKVAEITFKDGGSITVQHHSRRCLTRKSNAFLNLCGLQSFTSTLKI